MIVVMMNIMKNDRFNTLDFLKIELDRWLHLVKYFTDYNLLNEKYLVKLTDEFLEYLMKNYNLDLRNKITLVQNNNKKIKMNIQDVDIIIDRISEAEKLIAKNHPEVYLKCLR